MAQQMMGNMGMGGGQAGGTPGAGMPDMSKMQEMMQNPSIGKLLNNPEFLDSTL